MKVQYRSRPEHTDWNRWNTISPRGEARVYKGTWGAKMIQDLIAKGYTMPHIAGIWEEIPHDMTYQEFVNINWQEVK